MLSDSRCPSEKMPYQCSRATSFVSSLLERPRPKPSGQTPTFTSLLYRIPRFLETASLLIGVDFAMASNPTRSRCAAALGPWSIGWPRAIGFLSGGTTTASATDWDHVRRERFEIACRWFVSGNHHAEFSVKEHCPVLPPAQSF